MTPDDRKSGGASTAASDPPEAVAPDPSHTAAVAAGPDLAEAERTRDEYLDLLLRKTAEFDNYRRRVERERRDLIESAGADVLSDLLAVVDDFERALVVPTVPTVPTTPSGGEGGDAYRRGVDLIYKQLIDLLRKRGVTPVDSVGETFDPHRHQAVDYAVTGNRPDGEILEVYRRGYQLGDRLLRPAMVKVAKSE